MADAKVRRNSLHFNGKNYFRVGSETCVIGAVGEKRSPLTKGNYLEVKDRIKGAKLRIREIGPVAIDSRTTSKTDFLANISLAKVFRLGSVETAYEDVCNHKLDLVFFAIDTSDMVRAINDSPVVRDSLRRWGKDARVVTAGFVVVDASTSKAFASSTQAEASITVQGVTIEPKLTTGKSGNVDVEFPTGALLAYDLSSVEFDKQGGRVVDLRRDDHGI